MIWIRSGSTRLPVAPLAALFAFAVLAMTWVASSHVCARPVMMSMPGMPGMDMSGMDMSGMDMGSMPSVGGVMICPVVLGLIVLSTALSAWAIVVAWRDPQRAVTAVALGRLIAQLPPARTFAVLATAGGAAIATIVAIDGHQAFDPSLCPLLAAILAGISLAATVCASLVARIALALCARHLLALAQPIVERARPSVRCRRPPACSFRFAVVLLASGRGLRAPPALVH